jgi:hypothetical protein
MSACVHCAGFMRSGVDIPSSGCRAVRRSTAATFGSSGPVPIRPERGCSPPQACACVVRLSSATRRAPVVGPDGAPEASRDVIASHAAGAAPAPPIRTPLADAPGRARWVLVYIPRGEMSRNCDRFCAESAVKCGYCG